MKQQTFYLGILVLSLLCACGKASEKTSTVGKRPSTQQNIDTMIIENEFLKAVILKKGAELSSLKNDSLEYIWQADPKFWPRHSPVLFPIVGRLKDHEYLFEGKTYSMAQHGFARDMDFEIVEQNSYKGEYLQS